MENSDDPQCRPFVATCYLDESGNQEGGRLAVTGGPVIPQKLFTSFDLDWDTVLQRHGVSGPIHMREFARPNGRLGYLSDDERNALFQDLVHVITQNKLYSISTSILEQDFREFFPTARFKGLFGPAPLAFIWVLVLNGCITEQSEKMAPMGYVVAQSDEAAQMIECHSFIRNYFKTQRDECIGNITFSSPRELNALQASDLIAWSNRRSKLEIPFDQGFGPLKRLTRHVEGSERNFPHFHFEIRRESTQQLAAIVNGEFPDLPRIGTIKLLLTEKDRKKLESFRTQRKDP